MSENRILILAGNFYPEPTGIGKYNGEMIEWLAKNGYKVTVITTFPYYPHWKVQQPYTKRCYWFKNEKKIYSEGSTPVEVIRCPHYVPKRPSGTKRIISDFSILFATFLVILKLMLRPKYCYVMTIAPPFQTGLLAIIYKKIKRSKILYHVQDLQVDAARELGMIKSGFLINTLFKIEKFILTNTDHISSISGGMIERLKDKVDKKIHFLPNWVETQQFFPIPDKARLKRSFGFSASDKIVLYSGAIGQKQGIEIILHTANSLKERSDIKFVICGAGPYKMHLVQLQTSLGLGNVIYFPLQPYEKFNEFLNMADLHLVLQKAGASDLVMPSKLSTILSVGGVAIVTAPPNTSLYNYITSNEIGIVTEPDDQSALIEVVLNALVTDQSYIQFNARSYAERYLAIDNISAEYFYEITDNPKQTVTRSNQAVVKCSNPV